jgi:hypothetical protein
VVGETARIGVLGTLRRLPTNEERRTSKNQQCRRLAQVESEAALTCPES